MKLTKEEIRAVLDKNSVKHTMECREVKGNKKGTGGHWPPNSHRDMGGYRCICDWMDRVIAHHKASSCPEGLEHWTADTCAEVLPGIGGLYDRLWAILAEAKSPTPLGGDITVEEPSGRLDSSNDDKAKNFWSKLTAMEQGTLAVAFVEYEADL